MRSLVMGGQACVLYGGAEFSRDLDLIVLADSHNLDQLRLALAELQAETIAVPAFAPSYLERGHAVHFRCRDPAAWRLRIDVMSRLRGVDAFEQLWARRTTFDVVGEPIEALGLPDLVRAKKTQRDKDWLMLTRLLEAHYLTHSPAPEPEQVRFWLLELRTPSLLIECAARHATGAAELVGERGVLASALANDELALQKALAVEEQLERDADVAYWRPLMAELEELRRQRRAQSAPSDEGSVPA